MNGNNPAELYFYRGRTAMHALLRALNIGAGDEVIVQAYTCLAVALPILAVGANPVYADVDPRTYTAEPAGVRSLITRRTRVIVVQHTFGIPSRLDELMTIARGKGIAVLEDCCHVCGSSYASRSLGSFGDAAYRSYQWSKPIVIGRGGAAVVNEPSLVAPMTKIYEGFVDPPIWEIAGIHIEYLAYSMLAGRPLLDQLRRVVRTVVPAATGTFKRDELNFKATRDYRAKMPASLIRRLRAKKRAAEASIESRRSITKRYHESFQRIGVSNLSLGDPSETVLMSYPLLFRDRNRVIHEARRWGIQIDPAFCSPVEPLRTREEWARVGYRAGSCPNAEYLSSTTLTFPIRDWLEANDIDDVIAFVSEMAKRGYIEARKP